MTQVDFQLLTVAGFRSFADAEVLKIEKRPVGVHYVRGINRVQPRLGANGSGKTSLWGALCWCLYGRTVEGLRNPDIRPWSGPKKSVVTVDVTVDGKRHVITRTANPNRLLIDAKDAGQDMVDALIGMSYEVFTNTILLGQGQPLFFDLKPADKMQLFVDVLDLDKWDARAKLAAGKVTELELQLAGSEGELTGIEANLDQVKDLLKSAQRDSDQWEQDKRDRIASHDKDRKEAARVAKSLLDKLNAARMEFDAAETELKHHRKEADKQAALLAKETGARDDAETARHRLKERMDNLEQNIKRLSSEATCPLCRQPMVPKDVKKHALRISGEIDTLRKQYEQLQPTKALLKEIKDTEGKLAKHRGFIVEFDKKAEDALALVDQYTPRAAEAVAELKRLQKSTADIEKEENPYGNQISKLKRRRVHLVGDKQDLEDSIRALTARIERTRFWVRGFKDIRLYVIDEVLQELELTTNAVLEEIGLADWAVQYSIEKETKAGDVKRGLTVLILSPDNKNPVRWEAWSGGEGQRLRLAGALALSEVLLNYAGIDPNMEILDEPTRHLSAEGVRELVEYLADRADEIGRHVFYVDHQAVESARFASTLTVIKDKDGSHLQGGLHV